MAMAYSNELVNELFIKYGHREHDVVLLLGLQFWHELHEAVPRDDEMRNKVRMLLGPHGDTVCRVLEIKRSKDDYR